MCPKVATVPTVYGIETYFLVEMQNSILVRVATVPTVYGIETYNHRLLRNLQEQTKLQQYLPFTVLKQINMNDWRRKSKY